MVKRRSPELDIREVLSKLSRRLAGNLDESFYGQEEKVSFLLDLLKRTVDKGESNSLLILGPHGSGKSALVRHVLAEASKSDQWLENVLLVRLNGFLQTDDKQALKEITRQLHLENVVGDKVFGSFADHLAFLLTSLKVGDKTSKPIIFILEEFDLFCSHRNQTLLYNLFDTAQSRAAPICVIGVSCQIDVTELLEKRVNSRFSHRHLHMMLLEKFDDYYNLLTRISKIDDDTDLAVTWNSHVDSVFKKKDIRDFFEKKIFTFDKTVSHMKHFLYLTLIRMVSNGQSELNLAVLESALADTHTSESADTIMATLTDLSILEICLLIAVKHISDIYENEPFNFEMVYHEYLKFKRRKYSPLPEERSVVLKCWENLQALEFISPKPGIRTTGQQLEYILHTSQLPDGVLKKAVEKYDNCPIEVAQWMSSSLHTCS